MLQKSVVHWDGKLLFDLSSSEVRKVDHLQILVSSLKNSNTKLLGIPKLSSDTWKATANTVFEHFKSRANVILKQLVCDSTQLLHILMSSKKHVLLEYKT